MADFQLAGIIGSLLTPFQPGGSTDLESLRCEVRRLDNANLAALFVGGPCSELAGSTPREYREVCATVTAETRRHVLAGIFGNSLSETLELIEAASSAGVHAIAVAQPHYLFQPDTSGLIDLFRAVRKVFPGPVIVANTLSSAQFSMGQLQTLVEEQLTDAIYQGPSDMHRLADLLEMNPSVPVLAGVEPLMFVALVLGAQAAVSSLATLFPEDCVNLYQLVQQQDFAGAREIHERLLRVWSVLDHSGERFARLKLAASLRGYSVGSARSPYDLLPDQCADEVRTALAAEGQI